MTNTTKQIKQKYGSAYVTSVKITDVHVPREDDTHPITSVRGYFEFDGRIRSGQKGRFWTKIVPGELVTRTETNFTVEVVKAKHIQWREMKQCEQKDSIQMELTAHVMNHLSVNDIPNLKGEQNENVLENVSENALENVVGCEDDELPEYDVETERALALEQATSDVDLNDMVAKAAVKDSNDLLEIPSFLKRS